jgi:hypothetical protein
MTVINELIREEADGTISFGDYTLDAKAKFDNFNHNGAVYKVKTFKDITKLECDNLLVYESVPGTAVFNFNKKEGKVSFSVTGKESTQITLGLDPETSYEITVDGKSLGEMNTNLGGKLSFSIELTEDKPVFICVK